LLGSPRGSRELKMPGVEFSRHSPDFTFLGAPDYNIMSRRFSSHDIMMMPIRTVAKNRIRIDRLAAAYI
jgi:hypothetical protein